jgi:sialic acid synthase SpsE
MSILIIAEAGCNHNGKLDTALRLCDAAKSAGADIVKFQTFTPEKCIRKGKDYALLTSLALDQESFLKIAQHCGEIGIEFCSTPDHVDDLSFLVEDCGVKRIKLGSGSLLYEPLVNAAFDTGLPILLSTGMATIDEVAGAVGYQFNRFNLGVDDDEDERTETDRTSNLEKWNHLTVMHCVSLYPCPPHLANLSRMEDLTLMNGNELDFECGQIVDYDVGYSDHTEGSVAAMTAVALGATVVEKHFTLNKLDDGPDHRMSADSWDLKAMISSIREVETVLGHGRKEPSEEELAMIPRIRKDAEGFQPGL